MLRHATLALVGLALGFARVAEASPPIVQAPPSAPRIAAGLPVDVCGWPTTVAVSSGTLCSGALIHPRVVVYAAHCGGGNKLIRFGEDAWDGGRTVAVESCAAYPGYAGASDQGHDWAYCLLAEPVEDLPIAPPLYGCERELLDEGVEVAIVGYGQTLDEPSGLKRWALTTLAAVTPSNNTTLVGNPSANLPSICMGDSGGPALLQLDDGSWRTIGVASTTAGECGGYGAHSTLAGMIPWLEQDSGVDVTPCHAIDGSWAPGPACAGALASDAGLGVGSWDDWCAGTPRAEASSSCGPAWDEFDPAALPSVAIVSPVDRETFLEGIEVDVQVAAAKHPDGFAIASVSLAIDGEITLVDDAEPWRFVGPPFAGPGIYSLVAIAEDWAGNRVESEAVLIGWGDTEFPEPTDGEEESSDEPSATSSDSRCAIANDAPVSGWTIAVFALAITARRRRDRFVD